MIRQLRASFRLVIESEHSNFPAVMKKENREHQMHLIEGWAFTSKNYIIFAIGVVLIALGYIVMAAGETTSTQSLTIAPILLFLGYVVVIPTALIYRDNK
ncbi:MAG: DUF3098 domain-containing protein [Fidelibacterota bacterium]